jgi:hypothetical protein
MYEMKGMFAYMAGNGWVNEWNVNATGCRNISNRKMKMNNIHIDCNCSNMNYTRKLLHCNKNVI